MASIFTYDPNPPRVSSPWSTPGSLTPTTRETTVKSHMSLGPGSSQKSSSPIFLQETGITRLEAEPQDGSTEYKLHLLLRPRRAFTSSSTCADVSGSYHSKSHPIGPTSPLERDSALLKPSSIPSNLTRQTRLQQLTTQLLWRLQQSSPFHSSSHSDLVLPLLPEALPKLGVPSKRANLLPGLEESQGALYEIGVSDDGTLVGLIEEELKESLTNLRAMAASLGCVVDLLRKVNVGSCEWIELDTSEQKDAVARGQLWVAEALVRPDIDQSEHPQHQQGDDANISSGSFAVSATPEVEAPRSRAEQVRITLIGSTTAGKSSLLGTLSTSTLDNGRGKSRLSLLRHRHEISSGVTSSVAQELLGYQTSTFAENGQNRLMVVNYATPDVSAWNDIHNLADRLVFLSDSPGLPRYAKSTFRTLVSWNPHWTIVCVPADDDEDSTGRIGATASVLEVLGSSAMAPDAEDNKMNLDLSLAHIGLCLKLQLPLVIVITKMDLAIKVGLRKTLAKIFSVVKDAGRRPVTLSNDPAQVFGTDATRSSLRFVPQLNEDEINRLKTNGNLTSKTVPIVFTSAVTGSGIGKLHAILSSLPLNTEEKDNVPKEQGLVSDLEKPPILFNTDEVFMIPPSKVYVSSPASKTGNSGVVLCGYMSCGTVSVGDILTLGPFILEYPSGDEHPASSTHGSNPYSPSTSHSYPKGSPLLSPSGSASTSIFIDVRVVSLRNLRLPVRTLLSGQVGTVGVEPTDSTAIVPLIRARKGMILTQRSPNLTAYRIFSACFPATEFATKSAPPLILGGHAVVHVGSVRAAVKVTALARAEDRLAENVNVFDFDFEGDGSEDAGQELGGKEVRISFRFVSSVECMQIGNKVLVVPAAAMTGPVAGAVAASTGLGGFVGWVCDAGY